MAAQTIIPKQTAAVIIPVLIKITQELLPVTLMGDGLTGSDSIPISLTVDDGVTSFASSQDNTAVALTVTNNTIAINSPMTLRVTKPMTSGTAGVFLAAATEI